MPPEDAGEHPHQNCVFYPFFLATLWSCGVFFSEVAVVAGGIIYIFARQIYFNGYIKSTKKRLSISLSYLALAALVALSLLSLTGIVSGILHKYFHIQLKFQPTSTTEHQIDHRFAL
ncbi:microsomal glutathione S-transferase 2-like [Odontesthes bonariensis]|uniref:microsomal glutathione S-transferase 2-like n=1 Tax=Odontesthes bonariensis TaxID=219752 RepID=UPI003F58D871